mgnify:CR=1 FL=1|tara:strand:- start:1659 stop:2516 length:858 start_codon:yes stop_codon:yes gene_type:complete
MDIRLLIEQQNKIALTLINPRLYSLVDDKSIAYFHDQERSDLFFIHLNDYLKTEFTSPHNNTSKLSFFELMINTFQPFTYNEKFNKFLQQAKTVKDFFFQTRYYKYYISPHEIDLELSFADIVNYQSNYSKHSFYGLSRIKDKLQGIFEKNDIPNFENEDYYEHLVYFKEAVLDDRLNYNQTRMLEILGNYFLSYWDVINSSDNYRIKKAILNHIEKNGLLAPRWNIQEPENMNDLERFHWEIRGISTFHRSRIEEFIPITDKNLIEKETSPSNKIDKSDSNKIT